MVGILPTESWDVAIFRLDSLRNGRTHRLAEAAEMSGHALQVVDVGVMHIRLAPVLFRHLLDRGLFDVVDRI